MILGIPEHHEIRFSDRDTLFIIVYIPVLTNKRLLMCSTHVVISLSIGEDREETSA